MIKKISNAFFLTLLILNGLFFLCNIYVIGNREEIIKMHQDLVPAAGAFIANAKVIGVFITGILYIITALCIIKKKYRPAFTAIISGFVINNGLYIAQLIMWADIHPRIWIHLGIFGGLNLVHVIYTWISWKRFTIL
jgi:hypothetical protein